MELKCTLLLALLAGAAQAETTGVSPTGFTVTHRQQVKASPRQVIEAIGRVDRWWNGEHTYSGNPANLRLELAAGGCFCERWDGGSIQHAQVLYVGKDAVVRLQGALGPLQELPVTGLLSFVAATVEGRTMLTTTYRVAGPGDVGLEKWAGAVDKVIGEQAARLASFVDTGKP